MTQQVKNQFARDEWKNNCRFHPHSEKEFFDFLEKRLRDHKGGTPVVLLDLDSTLYEVAPRTHAIIQDWIRNQKNHARQVIEKLETLSTTQVGYSLKDTFQNIGLSLHQADVEKAWSELKNYWQDRFFTNEYLHHDRAYPGASRFANLTYELGATLVYLTGREEKPMIDGTIKNLLRDKFPWNSDRTILMMRQSADQSDLEHKALAAERIKKTGTLIASFENEPQNLVALYRSFPDSLHVFMETVSSDHPADALEGLYRIKSFPF